MSAKEAQTMRRLIDSIKNADRGKTSGYDTTATVRRIEDGVAWVHIPGGVDETPVKLTIAAAPGDSVQVRVSGGRAFLVGNATAPPTDDTTARAAVRQIGAVSKVVKTVQRIAEQAARIAGNTNQYFWHTESGTDTGAHITEIPQEAFLRDPENGGGNLLARSNGIAVRDGLTELAQFSAAGTYIYGDDGIGNAVEVAHLGYGEGKDRYGADVYAPYFSFGIRDTQVGIGNYSVAEGHYTLSAGFATHAEGTGTRATGIAAHAEGEDTIATGAYSHAQNLATQAQSQAQTAIGKYNEADRNDLYAFIIGGGTSATSRKNILTVDWDGNLDCANHKCGITERGTDGYWTWYKYDDGSFDLYRRVSATITSYATSGGFNAFYADLNFPSGCVPATSLYQVFHDWQIGTGFSMSAGTMQTTTTGFRLYGLGSASGQQTCVINVHVHGTYQQ